MDTPTLLKELAPTVEDNLNRHLGVAQEWMPHEYIPWSDGRNFALLDGEPWSVEQSTLITDRPDGVWRSTSSPRTTCRATTTRSRALRS